MTNPVSFPDGFLWGTATAAHQIEGGNTNNDWWKFEHTEGRGTAESSGDACDSWNRWKEDQDLVASFGLGAYRFSIEWSRIEPAEDEFSVVALDHYRAQLAYAHSLGIKPVVTFHHFTTPQWLANRGGWEAPDAPERFAKFVGRAAEHLGDLIAMACTINEPNVVAFIGYRIGFFPPGGVADKARYEVVAEAFCRAHRLAVAALRKAPGDFPIGMTLSMADWQVALGGASKLEQLRSHMEDRYLAATEGDDFIGVQCYTRHVVGPDGVIEPDPDARRTLMGYEFYPECTGATVRRAAEVTGLPVYLTENGIGTERDEERIEYLDRAIRSAHGALADGVDLRGYFCWSLLDNFEWVFGYRPTFGLVEVDRSTFKRTPKPSAAFFGGVATANAI